MKTESAALSDRAVAYLRTVTPVLWGSLVALVLRLVSPHLPGDVGRFLGEWLGSEGALTLVTAAVIAAWYWVWQRIQHRIPAWLARVALGSAKIPAYDAVAIQSPDGAVAGPGSTAPTGTPVAVLVVDEDSITDAGQA